MTGDAIISSKPTELNFGITNVKAYIAIILDLDELNYDQWFELFTIHCKTFGVYGHLTGTMKSSDPTNDNWEKRDNLVKLCLYGTIRKALVKRVLKKDLKACDIWKNLKDVFHVNKEAKAMQLDTKLRNLSLYHSILHQNRRHGGFASNMEAPVSNKSFVTYAINSLGNKFDQVASIIHHRGPFPTFDTARPMLLVEESLLNRDTTHHSLGSSSSSSVLIATSKGPTHALVSSKAVFGLTGLRVPLGFCDAPSGPRVEYGPDGMYITLLHAFNTMTLQEDGDVWWYMDT
ncbi:hypothetical protein Tco_0810717 [Tanacetum coccineum]